MEQRHFILQPASGGYWRLTSAGNGSCLQTDAGDPASINAATYSGDANQQWAIVSPSAPAFPAGLSALAASSVQITLTWNAVTGASGYNLKRSATSGGPCTTIASGVIATNYTDTIVAGVQYYYVVSAVSGGVESVNSLEATVNLPYPWQTQDVGSVGISGGGICSNGVFTVTGSGADIWGSADAFQFVYTTVSGDCTLIARVASVQNIDGWSKAGVMIRSSLDSNAPNAFVAVTPGNGVTWQCRSSTNGSTANAVTGGLSAPYWVKLVRSGNTFTGYRSPDGTNWTQQGTANITMASTVYVGMAVTAHNNGRLCAATFDNVTMPGWPPPVPPTPTGLVVASGMEHATLTWLASSNATSYNVKRSTTNGGPYAIVATVATTNCNDSGLISGTTYYYVVSAANAGGESANSGQASATPTTAPKLTGTIIGTAGSWGGSGDTIAKVFDNNLSTFFDAPNGNGAWVGLDFGAGVSNVITRINYCPRSGSESRMVGGIFQGANNSNFSDAVTLFTITNQPVTGGFTSATNNNASAFRYVRYLSPNDGFGNVAELQFYGYPWSALVPVTPTPDGLTATAVSSSQINLVWNGLTNATSYNVKRSLTNGGSYTTIASGVTATNYLDSGLAGGTLYYYVVNAVVSGNATPDSAQASAATLSPTLGSLVHRYSFGESGGTSIADSVGGPVWNGTLPSGGTLASGQLTLATVASQYASLPTGIVGTLSNFTIVAWGRLNSTANWTRIFDFGSGATANMFLTPQNGGDARLRFAITTNGGGSEQQINGNSPLHAGVSHQVAVTLNGNKGVLYLNGLPVGTNNAMTLNPAMLGSTGNNYLGRSQYPDPYLDGSMDEFRIYNVGLSAGEIAATFALGSSQQLGTNRPVMNTALTGANLTLSWPLANAGFILQARTNLTAGEWMSVTSPSPQIVGGQWQVALPPANADSLFYRLVR